MVSAQCPVSVGYNIMQLCPRLAWAAERRAGPGDSHTLPRSPNTAHLSHLIQKQLNLWEINMIPQNIPLISNLLSYHDVISPAACSRGLIVFCVRDEMIGLRGNVFPPPS